MTAIEVKTELITKIDKNDKKCVLGLQKRNAWTNNSHGKKKEEDLVKVIAVKTD